MKDFKLIPRFVLLLFVLCVAVFALTPTALSSDLRAASTRINEDPVLLPDSTRIIQETPWQEGGGGDGKGKSGGDTQPAADEQMEDDSSNPVGTAFTVESFFLNWYLPILQ